MEELVGHQSMSDSFLERSEAPVTPATLRLGSTRAARSNDHTIGVVTTDESPEEAFGCRRTGPFHLEVLEDEDAQDRSKPLISLVPGAGLEPAFGFPRGILSPLRIPISPSRLGLDYTWSKEPACLGRGVQSPQQRTTNAG